MTEKSVSEVENEDDNASAAMASMTAGYKRQRHIEPDVEVKAEPVVDEVTSDDKGEVETDAPVVATDEAEPVTAAEPATPAEPAKPNVDEIISELAAKVDVLNETPASVRKIYGELGNIQRALKQLQEQPKGGTSSAEVDAALKSAEDVAKEYPELAGPLVNVLKVISAHRPAAASSPAVDITSALNEGIAKQRQLDAIELLKFDHPDYVTVRTTPEYKEWLTSKDEAFRTQFNNTWNAQIVSKGLNEFKAWREKAKVAKAAKTSRLEAAITPKGDGVPASAKLPDSAGLSVGYEKVRKLKRA